MRAFVRLSSAALALLAALGSAPGAAADTPPPARVVSINVCTDQLAMLLAAPGQLLSVSHLARDPYSSAMAAEARAWPANRG
ncbi:MAG: ABC transporter substrate-binding protein, partial [Alphaproteobacteria bacterium HGW-Alphaproteobacteria-2]